MSGRIDRVLDGYDGDLCLKYGSFMHEIERPGAEAMYWIFFFAVLFLLFAASWRFGRVMERTEGLDGADPQRRRLIARCYWIALAAGFLSLGIAVLECFVIMTLQFCDQEPLASLYWSTWTVLQVGAVVAIFGIALHTRHMIRGRRPPPWALALGTPVLVVAGLGHYVQHKVRRGGRALATYTQERSRSGRSMTKGLTPGQKEEPGPLSEAYVLRAISSFRCTFTNNSSLGN